MRIIFTIVFVFFYANGSAQSKIRSHVKANTSDIRSIDIADTNYSDLNVIAAAIGNSRIVMLGEQDHGDGTTFSAKLRLVRFLHEKHGFNVIAFESDFFALGEDFKNVLDGNKEADNYLDDNLFPIWSQCAQFRPFYSYLNSRLKSNKLKVAGIDIQLHGEYSKMNFAKRLDSFLVAANIAYAGTDDYHRSFKPMVDSVVSYSSRQKMFPGHYEITNLISQIDTILLQLKAKAGINASWVAYIENLRSVCYDQLERQKIGFAHRYTERDKHMAINLAWLLKNKYQNEKVIVWAANGHIIKNAETEIEPAAYRHPSLGKYFTHMPEFKDKTYVMGFTSYQGKSGRTTVQDGVYDIPKPGKESLEEWMNKRDRQFAFVDFTSFKRSKPGIYEWFMMNGESHFEQKGIWVNAFDGVFFIKDMLPCNKL